MTAAPTQSAERPQLMTLLAVRCATALMRSRVLLALGILLGAVGGVVMTPVLGKEYVSSATVQIRKSLTTAMAEDAALKPTEAAGQISEDYRTVQTSLFESERIRQGVAHRLDASGWQDPEPGLKAWAMSLVRSLQGESAVRIRDPDVVRTRRINGLADFVGSGLSVRRSPKSPLIRLEFACDNPGDAQRVLQLVMDEYEVQLASMYDIEDLLKQAREVHTEALERWNESLGALELARSRADSHDPAITLERLRSELARVESEILRITVEGIEGAERSVALELALNQTPSEFPAGPTRFVNGEWLVTLDLIKAAKRRQVDSPFIEGSPEFRALQSPVVELEELLSTQDQLLVFGNPPRPNISYFGLLGKKAEAEAACRGAALAREKLRARAKRIEQVILALETCSEHITRLAEDERTNRRRLEDRADHLHRMERVASFSRANLLWSYRLVQEPSLPTRPSSPGRGIQAAMVFAAIVALVLGFVVARGLLDDRVRGAYDISHVLGSPPLACIPNLRRRREVKAMLRQLGISRGRPRLVPLEELPDFGQVGEHSPYLRSRMDALVASVLRQCRAEGVLRVSVCGVQPRCGATTLANNLAKRLATLESGGVELVRDGECMSRYGASEPTRFVVYDERPPNAGPIASSLRTCDVCLIVVRGDETRRAVLAETLEALGHVSEAKLGVVINALHFHLPTLGFAA